MEVIVERFDAVSVIKEVVETTRILIGNKRVEVTASFSVEPLLIESDPVKFRQILNNLLSNAAKFTEAGCITVNASNTSGVLSVSVSDTGIGIREEDMGRLFSAFTQIEDAQTKRYEGTGLGLTITRHLVDLLGGQVSLQSIFMRGTTFTVNLPLAINR